MPFIKTDVSKEADELPGSLINLDT
jgi:hypothetical protein